MVDWESYKFFRYCNSIVFVVDDTDQNKYKVSKALRSIQILDSQSDYALEPRLWLLKNKCIANDIEQNEIRVLGTVPMYQPVLPAQMARQIALSNMFEQLV